jgi:hypothetical protein
MASVIVDEIRLRAHARRGRDASWGRAGVPGSPRVRAGDWCRVRYDLNLWIGGPFEGATYLPR